MATAARAERSAPSEGRVLFLVGAVQFVNALDFMMVMPLGPDFARALAIPASKLGYIGGAYTAAAAVAGLVGMIFLDRFDRRQALAVAMLGLVCGTAAGGFAQGLPSLLAARVLAGACGGPAAALSLSIIADLIPAERRGRALGAVMGAFSVASVLGVPLGLEAARLGGWRAPFLGTAVLGLIVAAGAIILLPPFRAHLATSPDERTSPPWAMLRRPAVLYTLAAVASVMVAGFAIIPNLSAYLQHNLGYPREHLGLLYFVGGIVSFVAMRYVGGIVDRRGAPRVAAVATLLFVAVLALGFVRPASWLPVLALFVGFMVANSLRAVAMSTLTTRVPGPAERARFMSTQSAVQHLAAALGAFLAAAFLGERRDGSLAGMPLVAGVAALLGLLLPVFLWLLSRRLDADAVEAGSVRD